MCRILNTIGFIEVRQRGSHKRFQHPDGRATTVPDHGGRDLSPFVLRHISVDIGVAWEELIKHR